MPSEVPSTNTRVQLDMNSSLIEIMNDMMSLCEITTRKQLINEALSLFAWAVDSVCKGRTIASVDEANQVYAELSMPSLSAAARNKKRNNARSGKAVA
jgi:hypothetical protein